MAQWIGRLPAVPAIPYASQAGPLGVDKVGFGRLHSLHNMSVRWHFQYGFSADANGSTSANFRCVQGTWWAWKQLQTLEKEKE